MTLYGEGNVSAKWFRDRLEELRKEECFALVVVDEDSDARRSLGRLAEKGSLPIEPLVWKVDFEEDNFALRELVSVANAWAKEFGLSRIRVLDVERHASRTVVDAINRVFCSVFHVQKGDDWGRRLAQWAANRRCPRSLGDSAQRRPMISKILHALRAAEADYKTSVEWRREQAQAREEGEEE